MLPFESETTIRAGPESLRATGSGRVERQEEEGGGRGATV